MNPASLYAIMSKILLPQYVNVDLNACLYSWDAFSLCHWLHFDSDILMYALYLFIYYYCERAHMYVNGLCLSMYTIYCV